MQLVFGAQSYWRSVASRYWDLGPPLRPGPDDVLLVSRTLAQRSGSGSSYALLLGVTPDLAAMHLPETWRVAAVDRSLAMAREIWPGNVSGRREVVCSDWTSLPFGDSSFDAVLGDGALNCPGYPGGLRDLARSIRRVMTDGGAGLIRCFVPPAEPESPEAIVAEMWDGRIPTFHLFKLRLVMALQKSPEEGIALRAVHQYWMARNFDRRRLLALTGWDERAVDTIDMYQDTDTVLFFPSLEELRSLFSEFFAVGQLPIPSYELGERCPTLVLTWK
jgi:SAM-dependent methyltransferase